MEYFGTLIFIIYVTGVWTMIPDYKKANALCESGRHFDSGEICQLIKQDTTCKLDKNRQFIWKTITSKDEIVHEEMVLGTYEQACDGLSSHTFLGRLYFSKDFILMAKVSTSKTVFHTTVGEVEHGNSNFQTDYKLQANGVLNILSHFEILTNPYNVCYKWVKSKTISSFAVVCSQEFDQDYYCGRLRLKGIDALFPAKIINGVAHTPWYGVKTSQGFEYHVYNY